METQRPGWSILWQALYSRIGKYVLLVLVSFERQFATQHPRGNMEVTDNVDEEESDAKTVRAAAFVACKRGEWLFALFERLCVQRPTRVP